MKRSALIKKKKNQSVYHALCSLMEELKYVPKKKKILIKPNLAGSFKKNSPFSTSTSLVLALIKYFKKRGYKNIVVAEGTGNDLTFSNFFWGGYLDLQRKKEMYFGLIDLNNAEKEVINGIHIPKVMKEHEYINVAKLKTHMQTDVTLCIKNQKGLLPVWQKRKFHIKNYRKNDIHHNIRDLYSIIQPDLSIIDALSGIEGNGPVMGNVVKNMNLIIGGYDAIDVDNIGSRIMGFDPKRIKHIELCRKITKKKILIDDDTEKKIKKYRRNFKKPSNLQKIFKLYWHYGDETCSGCIGTIFELKQSTKNPKNIIMHPFKTIKIIFLTFFLGMDILTGNAEIPKKRGFLTIACGECCRKHKGKKGIVFVPGCPPKGEELYKKI